MFHLDLSLGIENDLGLLQVDVLTRDMALGLNNGTRATSISDRDLVDEKAIIYKNKIW